MARFKVRKRLSPHDQKFSGAEGAGGTVVYAETAAKAREIGMKRLGSRDIEVIQMDDIISVVSGPDRPLTKEEADEIWNQGASVLPNSWESV